VDKALRKLKLNRQLLGPIVVELAFRLGGSAGVCAGSIWVSFGCFKPCFACSGAALAVNVTTTVIAGVAALIGVSAVIVLSGAIGYGIYQLVSAYL